MIQETSKIAYSELNNIGDNQKKVIFALENLVNATDTEMADFLGFPDVNSVRPRRFELVEKGMIKEVGKRICKITGKTAIVWGFGESKKKELEGLSSSSFQRIVSSISKLNEFQKNKLREMLK